MKILIPGRHHILTDFQSQYFFRLLQKGLQEEPDVNGNPLGISEPIECLIFAVTSANHSNTRRNPLPFMLRALPILDFCQELNLPGYIYGIDDVGFLDDFAGYTLKKIRHESDGFFDLNPKNTLVACSTPVMEMYEKKGFRILPVELESRENWTKKGIMPWELVEYIAAVPPATNWRHDDYVLDHIYSASYHIWDQYNLGEKVQRLFSDDMIGDDGDLTETRDYGSYVRQMDEIAELKYRETRPYIRPGRIGDIGCAVGTWIKLACAEPRFRESDFFGIEVARQLYRICLQRKENGEFDNPYVFFAQKNAVTEVCFDPGSMNTVHTSSLTHEILSYGDPDDLGQFIRNRFEELAPGGVWINRDVVGPENGEQRVWMKLREDDGRNEDWEQEISGRDKLGEYLAGLSTSTRFLRFARDFRAAEKEPYEWAEEEIGGERYIVLSLRNAMEFIMTKDYTGNWQSEMHERFCFWSFHDWKWELEAAGFTINPDSAAYTNTWLVDNRFRGNADLFLKTPEGMEPLPYPDTHLLMIAEKTI